MVLQVGNRKGLGLSRGLPLIVLLLVGFLQMALDGFDGRFEKIDVDDALRGIEVRQLLQDGRWFDRTLAGIQMPDPYVSPWSRLVDLPYVILARLGELFTGPAEAVQLAFAVWPPMLFAVFCGLVAAILHRLAREGLGPLHVVHLPLILILAAPAVLEFVPGRIDHHNAQILALTLFSYGLVRADRLGGGLAGLAASASVVVGLESLPLVAIGCAAVVLDWCVRGRPARDFTLSFLIACAVATVLLGGAFVGVKGLFDTACDSFSAPFAFVLTVLPLLAASVILFLPTRAGPGLRLGAIVGLPLPAVASLPYLFGACLGGPYQMIDPVSAHFWFERVLQEGGIVALMRAGQPLEVLRLTALVAVLGLAGLRLLRHANGEGRGAWVAYGLALAALVLALSMFRYAPIAVALGTLFLPAAAVETGRLWGIGEKRRLALLAGALLAITPAAVAVMQGASRPADGPDVVDFMNNDRCEGADLSALEGLASARILAPPGLGIAIAERMQPGISVSGILFHRASPGLRRTYEALTSVDGDVRRRALSPFDHVAVCARVLPAGGEGAPLFRALAGGGGWPGLTPVGEGRSAFRLFAIDHATVE